MSGGPAGRRFAVADIALVVGYSVIYLATLGIRPLARTDEFRYAEIAREMLAGDDWVSPRLIGLRYFEKPVLGHWAGAASFAALGESSFSARIPSAVATGLTAVFIVLFLARVLRDRATALLAAFIYLTTLAVFGIGTLDVLDPLLTLWLTLTIGLYFCAWREPASSRRAILLALAGTSCGLAFLTKGFLALAVPMMVVAPFLIWQRQWKRLLGDWWLPFVVALAVALPWALVIHGREPDFWRYFFWEEHIRRFLSPDAQHARPFWLFLATFPAMALPWIFLAPAGIAALRRHGDEQALVRYLALWFLMPLLFFSISRGKLLSYILPCFPPFAMLLGIGLRHAMTDPGARFVRAGLRGILTLSGVLAFFLVVNRLGGVGEPLFEATEVWHWGAFLAALAAGAMACLAALRSASGKRRVLAPGMVIIPLLLVIPFAIPNSTRLSKMPGDFLHSLRPSANTVLVSDGVFVHAVAWTFGRTDIRLLTPGELAYGLSYPENRGRLISSAGFRSIIENAAGRQPVMVACDIGHEKLIRAAMPPAARRMAYGDLVVWRIPSADSSE